MTFTVNQILVACLVAELVVFLIVLAILAVHAISLIKTLKKVLGRVESAADSGKKAVDECKLTIKDTGVKLLDSASVVDKLAAGTGLAMAVVNYKEIVRKHTFLGSGVIGRVLDKRARKSAEKELRRTKDEVAKLRKAARKEAKAGKKASKLERELRKNK